MIRIDIIVFLLKDVHYFTKSPTFPAIEIRIQLNFPIDFKLCGFKYLIIFTFWGQMKCPIFLQ